MPAPAPRRCGAQRAVPARGPLRPARRSGCTVPTSLLARTMETSVVSAPMHSTSAPASTTPRASTATVTPPRRSTGWRTAWCSIAAHTTGPGAAAWRPRTARLSASVPLPVNTTSPGRQPSTSASDSRASSIARPRVARQHVRSGRVAEPVAQERQHRLDRLGPHRRRGGVVEVDELGGAGGEVMRVARSQVARRGRAAGRVRGSGGDGDGVAAGGDGARRAQRARPAAVAGARTSTRTMAAAAAARAAPSRTSRRSAAGMPRRPRAGSARGAHPRAPRGAASLPRACRCGRRARRALRVELADAHEERPDDPVLLGGERRDIERRRVLLPAREGAERDRRRGGDSRALAQHDRARGHVAEPLRPPRQERGDDPGRRSEREDEVDEADDRAHRRVAEPHRCPLHRDDAQTHRGLPRRAPVPQRLERDRVAEDDPQHAGGDEDDRDEIGDRAERGDRDGEDEGIERGDLREEVDRPGDGARADPAGLELEQDRLGRDDAVARALSHEAPTVTVAGHGHRSLHRAERTHVAAARAARRARSSWRASARTRRCRGARHALPAHLRAPQLRPNHLRGSARSSCD